MTVPQFRLAPGTGWGRASEPPAAGFRNSRWDRSALAVGVDPSWLLAPLYARDAAGLAPPGTGGPPSGTGAALPGPLDPPLDQVRSVDGVDKAAAAADWPTWWAAALAFRPGTPAPRVSDLIAESPALQGLWAQVESGFADWLAGRPQPTPASEEDPRRIERAALAGFAARNGRDPGRWAVRILQIPVAGPYLCAPDERRIVVSAALRHDADAYPAALAAELPRHF